MSTTPLPDLHVAIPFSPVTVKLTDYVVGHLAKTRPVAASPNRHALIEAAWGACQKISSHALTTGVLLMADINSLLPEHLERIKAEGDVYVHKLAEHVHISKLTAHNINGLQVIDPLEGTVTGLRHFAQDLLQGNPPVLSDEWQIAYRASRSNAALGGIKFSLARGHTVWASAVRALAPEHWLGIYQYGDAYLRLTAHSSPDTSFSHGERTRSRSDAWDEVCCFRGRTTRSMPCNNGSRSCPFREQEREMERGRGGRERDDYGLSL